MSWRSRNGDRTNLGVSLRGVENDHPCRETCCAACVITKKLTARLARACGVERAPVSLRAQLQEKIRAALWSSR